jgi:hypothetical protein
MANVQVPKRAAAATALKAPSTPKRLRFKCDIASQAIVVDGSQPHLSLRPSPRQALAASQAMDPVGMETRQSTEEMKHKVVVFRELHRAIIYTSKPSDQMTKSHVRTQPTVYLVN